MRLTFVVGTGRCGSTMLSAILREHPDVLSMSEFFGTVRAAAQAGTGTGCSSCLDGRDLWQLLASPFGMLEHFGSARFVHLYRVGPDWPQPPRPSHNRRPANITPHSSPVSHPNPKAKRA